jgi:hypothetical protein
VTGQTAFRFVTSSQRNIIAQSITVTSGTVYTFSFYIEQLTVIPQARQVFNFHSGVTGQVWRDPDGLILDPANNLPNKLGKYTITATANDTTIVVRFGSGVQSNTNADLVVVAPQLEAGAYATSYIPTTTAAVTRLADAASKTGISSLIGQTEGTIFIDFEYNQTPPDVNGRLLQLWGTSEVTNSILPLIFGAGANANRFQLTTFSAGSSNIPIVQSAGTTVPFGRQKFAIAYTAGVYTVYRNGSLFASGSGLAPVSLTALDLGGSASFDRNFGNPINQALLFKTRLPNSDLATLTSL